MKDIITYKEIYKYNYVLVVYINDNLEAFFSKSDIDLLDYAEIRNFKDYEIFELVDRK